MKDFLKKLIKAKEERAEAIRESIKTAGTADEVRSFGTELTAIEKEIKEAKEQLAEIEAEEARAQNPQPQRQFDPAQAVATAQMNQRGQESENPRETMEYRKAFMEYVLRGTKNDILQFEKRDASTSGELGVLIPQTVIQEIIKGVGKVRGQIYSRVKKTNVPGGVKYPIGSFDATFRRITESTVSERQKGGKITGYIEFSYNIGEIRLARTLLQTVLSVPVFEEELSKVIVEAYVEAMDKEIISGSSENGQCEGILTEAAKVSSRIPSANIIEFTAADIADWTKWQEKLFAKIPLKMRAERPEFAMTANTYEANIKTLKDSNNRPLYNETFNPVDGAEICTFKGKEVVLVEEDVFENFNDATNGEYFGMYWVPEKAYAINSNLEFQVVEYFDHETNQQVKKAVVINDGKVLNGNYIYLLKKKVVS